MFQNCKPTAGTDEVTAFGHHRSKSVIDFLSEFNWNREVKPFTKEQLGDSFHASSTDSGGSTDGRTVVENRTSRKGQVCRNEDVQSGWDSPSEHIRYQRRDYSVRLQPIVIYTTNAFNDLTVFWSAFDEDATHPEIYDEYDLKGTLFVKMPKSIRYSMQAFRNTLKNATLQKLAYATTSIQIPPASATELDYIATQAIT